MIPKSNPFIVCCTQDYKDGGFVEVCTKISMRFRLCFTPAFGKPHTGNTIISPHGFFVVVTCWLINFINSTTGMLR